MTLWTWESTWPAPAKLNLFLHVVGRRPDGYHLLQTVFRFIDRSDTLSFAPRDDGKIVLATPIPGVPPEGDLTVRAARLLQAEVARTGAPLPGASIFLDKRLPMGGGLGGGSSDAATVLLALNHLWQLGLPRQRLQELGLTLGADVPIFIFGRNAFAEGIGETLTPIDLPAAWYVVLEPPIQVPTAAIFSSPALKRDTPAIPACNWHSDFGHNDLEPVAAALFPEVAQYLAWLKNFVPARMSGSGACVFAELPHAEAAEIITARLPQTMRGWLAQGLLTHPLVNL